MSKYLGLEDIPIILVFMLPSSRYKSNTNIPMQIFVGKQSLSWITWLPIAYLQESDLLAIIVWDTEGILCHRSGGYSLASHCYGPGSIPDRVVWDLWWTKWHWGRFARVLIFPLPIPISPAALYSLIILSATLYSLKIDSVVKQRKEIANLTRARPGPCG
jgi:hypothetical protein